MTVQLDQPPREQISSARQRRGARLSTAALVAVVGILGIAGAVTGLLLSGTHGGSSRPVPVLGQARTPLSVYRVIALTAKKLKAGAGRQLVPLMGGAGDKVLLRAAPTIRLHVNYARVRPVSGHWFIEFTAPESQRFNHEATGPRFFDAVVDGRALTLIFTVGRFVGGPNVTNSFSIGAGPNRMTKTEAIDIARSLTTSVTIAQCSPPAIEANECA